MALHHAAGGEERVELGAGRGLFRRLQVAGGAVAGDEAAEPAAQVRLVVRAVAGHAAEGLLDAGQCGRVDLESIGRHREVRVGVALAFAGA